MGKVWSSGLRRAQKAVCRLADTVVTNAEAIAGRLRLEGYDPRRIEVIRNGIAGSDRTAPPGGGNGEMAPRSGANDGMPPPSGAGRPIAPLRQELGLPADAILVGAVC